MLRIDDRLDALGLKTAEAADQDSYKYIDLYPVMEIDEQVPGIRGWKSSLQFWQNISHDSPLDLIVSDVQFQRSGSPMQEGQDVLRAPLGLTHFKPLAAYVVSRGRPFGFALHTGDHGYWFNTRNSEDDQERLLARLAFHEIGEIAAILKQGETIVDSFKLESDEAVLKAANNWFESLFFSSGKTLNTFADAQPLSLSNYRRSLSEAYVRPSSWTFLRKWLSGLENKKRKRQKCILEEDVGIEFILPDGRIDKIRLRSIFADFENGVYDFDLTNLSSACFPIEYDENFNSLTENGFPKIGALLSACGSFSKAYHDAVIQAEHIDLPQSLFDRTANKRLFAHDGGTPTSIGKLKSTELDGMAIGLTILFKYVEIQKWLQDNWNF